MAEQFPEMPIEQDFGRFTPGIPGQPQETEDGGAIVDFENEELDVEELPDGSAVVNLDEFKGPQEAEDFYANMAESYDPFELDTIAMRYLDLIEKDKEARSERDKKYEEGIRRTGLGNDAPGGANFLGASKVVHPVMAEGCVDFASRAIKELFPPDGPVKTHILGDPTTEKVEVAERKRDYMNWQLTDQIEEFRDEQEQMLTQLPLGGSQYMKLWYDEKKRRPCAEFIPIDNIFVPYAAANFYTAQRVTERQEITEWEFKERINSGLYRDISFIRASMEPEQTYAEKANNKVEGRQWQDNEDGVRIVYHIYTWLSLEEDKHSKNESAPYILMIDELENKVVGLYRNWEDGDEAMEKLDWLVEFRFIPWRGAYAIGLPHLIGGLSAALTGALRALLDSAHINNAATMLKLKGARISGQSQQVEVTQVAEIEGAPGVDDVRKIAMPFPFNPPSQVLFSLLGWLNDAAKGVVSTSEEKIADITSQAPVGTTQALIEQGAAVFSAIHSRLHSSQKRVLMILQRINRWYLDDQKKGDVVAELPVAREDFRRNTDVQPVSDPHIFSETQRFAQNQAVLALAEKYPQVFNLPMVIERVLKQMKVPNHGELMQQQPKPSEMSAVDENVAMSLAKPAFAYPKQDHLAHIQTHLAYAVDPNFGANPIIAPVITPMMLEHVKQHMTLWYTEHMNQYVERASGQKLKKYEDTKAVRELDRAYAVASQHMALDSQDTFSRIMPILTQMFQQMQQMKQQMAPPMTPDAQAMLQASMAETQRRAAKDQADMQLDTTKMQAESQMKMQALQAELAMEMEKIRQEAMVKAREQQIKVAMNAEDNLTEERMKTADLTAEAVKLQMEQQRTAVELERQARENLGGPNDYAG
jgi:hypothetical protein